ncbi:alpha-L-fucosidase [Streptomyces coffeae]|uniref:alpha-L-fucosidase n=1 Tax=Streptomyces coffeae TaxID=621382 RepID=A0ABS1NE37_9ACTN|nr:alpha-L-fucosidase [Streptomyces coffeae]MBL1098303.1 alpha-L-fucosidase [Streptomyces coffeae]
MIRLLRTYVLAGLATLSLLLAGISGGGATAQAADPSPAQKWVTNNPFGMFLHYNMSTYSNVQWASPDDSPSTFNPTNLDADQWAKAIKSAGMTFGVLTAKHHDGFALWPTAYSSHDIAASPYKDGKGDIVREYVKAMRANGLKVGLYFSIWDRKNGDSEQLVKNQLKELLTNYGQIDYLWFDGWGWKVPYSTIPYKPVRDYIRELSPNTVVANNDHKKSLDTSDVIVYEVPNGIDGLPPTTNTNPTDGSDTLDSKSTWFHTTSTGAPRSAGDILTKLQRLKAGNALYLLNVGPNKTGKIPQTYVDRLKGIGTLIKDRNVAYGQTAEASSTYASAYPASKAVDDDPSTIFASTTGGGNQWWETSLPQQYTLSRVEIVFRNDGHDISTERRNFEVWVSNNHDMSQGHTVACSVGATALPYASTYTCKLPSSGPWKYVAVVKTDADTLTLAEVRVLGH